MPSRGLSELLARAARWGVESSWTDVHGARHEVPAATLEALLGALGAETDDPPAGGPLVVTRGSDAPVPRGVLLTESGEELPVPGRLPPDAPLGYHRLHAADGSDRAVVIGPGRCHLPDGLRAWGWAVQLYSLHSRASWGIGDLGDLRDLARWSRRLGAGTLLLNPLHFSTPVPPVSPSPYSPGSRRFRDPLYLRIEDVPGAAACGADLAALAQGPRDALRTGGRIDRDAVLAAKLAALSRIWTVTAGAARAEFAAWRRGQDAEMEAFGAWCAVAELHGSDWRRWPLPLQDRRSTAFAAEAVRLADRAAFHVWLQWLVEVQLDAAAAQIGLVHDLAIGVDPGGVDAWLHGDVLAAGVHVGAPPDAFNPAGQDWGVLPFDPWRLRAAAYAPFAATLRACMRAGGGLRIDHVMGLSRLYWVPPGAPPTEGAYVRYPAGDLFEVLALESVRASSLVVGEDLGTVEEAVRAEMAARDVLSYRLLWFEERPPAEWPERALAAVTTHDLPTVAGMWTGVDVRDQEAAGIAPDERGRTELRERLRRFTGLEDDARPGEAVDAAYAALAQAPCALLLATLEDLLAVEHRPNLPGTTAERWPSWSMPLPRSLEELMEDPRAGRLAEVLARSGGDA